MSTHQTTIRPEPTTTGWRDLRPAPGASHDGAPPDPGGDLVAVIAHLSDLHVCDAESPARIEYLERYGLEDGPYRPLLGEIGTYRPQEVLTVPVLAAMIESVNQLVAGPLTGQPAGSAVLTGDLVDNAQTNELDWYLTLLTGGTVHPGSGDAARSEWVGHPKAHWSPWFWHPDGHRGGGADWWEVSLAFPRLPGLLEAARQPVSSPGLRLPWFAVHGNHDLLLQGTVAASDSTRALAVGDRRLTDLPPDRTVLSVLEAVARCGPAAYPDGTGAETVTITPDPGRRLLDPVDFARRHRDLAGHGPVVPGPGNAFTAPLAPEVRLVAIDTVNPHGGWEGSLDRDQFEWLRSGLEEGDEPYVVVASHHPSWCLVNAYRPDSTRPRVLADEVLGLLLDRPRVIAWLAGHVHHHSITMHRRANRVLPEITAASLIDWPQQARVLEVVREPGGVLALASTAVDHSAPARPDPARLDEGRHLAAVSRALAANAPRLRRRPVDGPDPGPAGRTIERNAVIRIPDPGRP